MTEDLTGSREIEKGYRSLERGFDRGFDRGQEQLKKALGLWKEDLTEDLIGSRAIEKDWQEGLTEP